MLHKNRIFLYYLGKEKISELFKNYTSKLLEKNVKNYEKFGVSFSKFGKSRVNIKKLHKLERNFQNF